jgi:colanic acid biosynthesis protein WcaH
MPANIVPEKEWEVVVRNAPLISIDLIIKDRENRILVGLRANNPAKGHYFVPGGRVIKDETLDEAFSRILKHETGLQATRHGAHLLGVYEHHYRTNRFGDPGFGTHYVVLAYELQLTDHPAIKLDSQHTKLRWLRSSDDLDRVHENARVYFRHAYLKGISDIQYQSLTHRRLGYDALVWQTPTISLLAQTFLFAIAFGKDESNVSRLVASALAVVTAYASVQLFERHRHFENYFAKRLHEIEKLDTQRFREINEKPPDGPGLGGRKSHHVWVPLLWSFGFAALVNLVFITSRIAIDYLFAYLHPGLNI